LGQSIMQTYLLSQAKEINVLYLDWEFGISYLPPTELVIKGLRHQLKIAESKSDYSKFKECIRTGNYLI
jgi:hypothetical protein